MQVELSQREIELISGVWEEAMDSNGFACPHMTGCGGGPCEKCHMIGSQDELNEITQKLRRAKYGTRTE